MREDNDTFNEAVNRLLVTCKQDLLIVGYTVGTHGDWGEQFQSLQGVDDIDILNAVKTVIQEN